MTHDAYEKTAPDRLGAADADTTKPTTRPGPYAAAWAAYAAAGWAPIAVAPRGKNPIPGDYHSARKWGAAVWERYADTIPGANIGVLCDMCIAIDVDAPDGHKAGKDGPATFATLCARLGKLPATWTNTAHGAASAARQYLFRLPDRPGGWAGAFHGGAGDGVDICSPRNRFIVVAPSVHPKTGTRYAWYAPDGRESATPPRAADLPELPAPWLAYLLKPQRPAQRVPRPAHTAGTPTRTTTHGMCRAVETVLTAWQRDPMNGRSSRHDGTLAAVYTLANMCEEGHAGVMLAVDAMRNEYPRVIDDRAGEGEALAEFDRMTGGQAAAMFAAPGRADPCATHAPGGPDWARAMRHARRHTAAPAPAIAQGVPRAPHAPTATGTGAALRYTCHACLGRAAMLELPRANAVAFLCLDGCPAARLEPMAAHAAREAFGRGATVAWGRAVLASGSCETIGTDPDTTGGNPDRRALARFTRPGAPPIELRRAANGRAIAYEPPDTTEARPLCLLGAHGDTGGRALWVTDSPVDALTLDALGMDAAIWDAIAGPLGADVDTIREQCAPWATVYNAATRDNRGALAATLTLAGIPADRRTPPPGYDTFTSAAIARAWAD